MTSRLRLTLILLVLSLPKPLSSQQSVEWKDPSPHSARLVTVQEGVQLEVLDWAGSGRPLVLLAGLGDTAHVFDDFAPMLAKRYRVYGITRRGVGSSSAPSSGYEFQRLAEDVVRVIEELALYRPIILGHSIAGEELHVLGSRYREKIAGLIYIDAAFNRADGSEDYDKVAQKLPSGPVPQASDMASITTLRSFLAGMGTPGLPEAHLRSRYTVKEDGSIGAPVVPALTIRQAITAAMRESFAAYNPERISVPALAIYAVPRSPTDLMRPWYNADDPMLRETVDRLYVLARERFQRHAGWFKVLAKAGQVSEMSGAHHLFVTNASEVLREIDAFLSSVP